MSSTINVIKRNGQKEPLNFDKINNVLLWSTENIKHVSASDIAVNAGLQLFDGIKSTEIHKILIQSAADLISEKNTNYQYVASNLLNYFLRKNVFGVSDNLPHLKDVILKNVEKDVYDSLILEKYSDDEINVLNKYIKHTRDNRYTYAGLQQVIDKYLLKDRSNNDIYETPQYMYMLISMTLFMNESNDKRMKMVKDYYDNISLFKISLPTPILSGVRTPIRQYSSCTLIDIGDSLTSIFNSNSAVGYYTARRAGIGLNFSRIRAVGDKIRNGEVMHTGVVPFLKMFESTTKSCTQNGIRGGSSTTHFQWWHREILDILVLKNNKGTDDNRVRKMDYSIQLNRIFYKRFVQDGDITLFSPNDVPDLYEAFYKSNDEFEALYEKYERSRSITTKKIKARDLFNSLLQERIGTGRIYIMNIDHVNDHSSLLEPVYMSNLCQEISLNTTPINHIDDGKNVKRLIEVKTDKIEEYKEYIKWNDLYINEGKSKAFEKTLSKQKELLRISDSKDNGEAISADGKYTYFEEDVEMVYGDKPAEIALCVLAAINLGEIKELSELEDICEYTVRSLDFVIENQDYPVEAAKKMLKRRSLGVGITNLAYFLAKNDLTYEDPKALVLLDEVMEHIQYYLIKASVKLAKEYGPCKYFKRTKYAQGILPIDTYNKNVDTIVKREYTLDWEQLRKDVLEFGMRNSTLTAIMPCESSSLVSNSTNGIEPIRSLVVSKKSKQGVIRQVAPEMNKLKNKYQLAFNMTSNKGITNIQAVIQKWIDQSISGNHYYDVTKYKDGNISLAEIATDLLYAYKMGIKNLYYANTYDNKTDKFDFNETQKKDEVVEMVEDTEDCVGGACSI